MKTEYEKMATIAIAHMSGDGIASIVEGWAQELIEYAKVLGYTVLDIEDDIFEPLDAKPALLIHFFPAKMPQNLSGVAVVTYSGKAEFEMGADIIKAGSPVFVGFNDNLVVVSDKFESQDIFKNALLPLAKRILDGWTVGDAIVVTKAMLLHGVKKYKDYNLISVPLWYNRKYLTVLGDANWKFCSGKI